MRRFLCLFAALVLSTHSSAVLAEETEPSPPQNRGFLGSTAYTVEQGRWEIGLFGPLRYGLTDRLELSTHPLFFFVSPNLQAKIHYPTASELHLATVHSLVYPTPVMRLFAREGAGGLFPPDRDIPHLISIRNEVVATRPLRTDSAHLLTAATGLQVAPRFGTSQLVPVELPVVYPRTAAFFTYLTVLGRAELTGPIFASLHYHLGAHIFVYPGAAGSFALEQTGRLEWRNTNTWTLRAGYLATFAGYPFGLEGRILPTLEAAWAF